MLRKIIYYINNNIDLFVIINIYLAVYIYAITYIPEAVIPPKGTDPFCFDILTDIMLKRGFLLKDFSTYFFSPLDVYFLFLIKVISTDPVMFFKLVILIQLTVFIISAVYFKKILGLLFRGFIIKTGFYLYCLYPPLIFYAITPVQEIITVSALVFAIYNLMVFAQSGKKSRIFLAGIFFSIVFNMRMTVFFITPVLVWFIYQRKKLNHTIIFLFGLSIFILPFGLRNFIVGRQMVLLSSVSGIHFYIGNHSKALGVYTFIKGIRPSAFGHYIDTKRIAEKELGHKLSDKQVNAYWKKSAWNYICGNPFESLKLYLKKLVLLANYEEIPNNYGFDYFKNNYFPFKLLNYPYSFSILFIGGIMGLIFSKIRFRRFFLLNFIILFLVSGVIFVTSRYRLHMVVFLMIGICGGIDAVLNKEIRLSLKLISCALILTVITYYPIFDLKEKFYLTSKRKHNQSAKLYAVYMWAERDVFFEYYANIKRGYLKKFISADLM